MSRFDWRGLALVATPYILVVALYAAAAIVTWEVS